MAGKDEAVIAIGNSATIQQERSTPLAKMLTPIVISVFAAYLTIGITLGILPVFVKNNLGFDSLVVGLVIGAQSLATLLTRAYAGRITDTRGANISNRQGILMVLIAGMLYMLVGAVRGFRLWALGLLIVSRIIHGISESMLVTGALTWGIGLVGQQNSGKVMTWNGIAMYAGIAIGAPFSIWLVNAFGVTLAFASVIVLSLVSWWATAQLPVLAVDPSHVRPPFYKVIGQVSGQGLALAFSSMGFACIASFIALFFAAENWHNASLGFFCFGACYILTRVFFAYFPDKYGGYKVAMVSFMIEIIGQLCIGFSNSGPIAILGCALTGIGFSLVFPSLGVLVIKKVPPQTRGTALGAYAAFFDLSLGLAGPIAGIVAQYFNYHAIYLVAATSCLLAFLILLTKQNNK